MDDAEREGSGRADPEPADPGPADSGSTGPGHGESADPEYAVTLEWVDGRREAEAIAVEGGETVLDAAEAAGIALPFGCRTGACATCTARLQEGAVEYRRPPRALKDRHLAEGYVLTCVATPTEDCRLVVGADVASELVSNPWK